MLDKISFVYVPCNGHTKFVVSLFDTDHSVGLVASSEDCINMFVMTPKDECPCVELLGLILIVILQQRPDRPLFFLLQSLPSWHAHLAGLD